MAKKVKKMAKKAPANPVPETMLPQNILPMGERVEENKNIYIAQAVYKQIRKFTKDKTTDESGGMLVGTVIEEFGKTNIIISGFVEAKFCEATPTTLKFTHETWAYVHKEIDKKHKGKKIVGWIHTHPDFGIFLSEYDSFIHQNFFSDPNQIAYVVDPIQQIEGFYFWINGKIEKCKGFYIYDKTGAKITVDVSKEAPDTPKQDSSRFGIQSLLTVLLSVAVVFLIFSNISTANQLKQLEANQALLETQQLNLANSANQALYQMQQLLSYQDAEIQQLTQLLKDAGIIVESEPTDAPEETDTSEDTEQDSTGEATEGTEDAGTTEGGSGENG